MSTSMAFSLMEAVVSEADDFGQGHSTDLLEHFCSCSTTAAAALA